MIYAYLRQLPGIYTLSRQQKSIISYSLLKSLEIGKEVMEYSNVNQPISERKEFEEFLHTLKKNDIIVVQDLLILSQYVDEIIQIINCMLSHDTDLHIISSNIVIKKDTTISELLPLLNQLSKKQIDKSASKGRPKGSHSSSKFDKFQSRIIYKLKDGMSVSAISRELGVSRSSLKDYIQSRELKQIAERIWDIPFGQEDTNKKDNSKLLLICPFEKPSYKETDHE